MTALLDWSSKTDLLELVPIAARTASGQGAALNVQAYTGIAFAVLQSAAGTGTSPLLSAELQDSLDGTTGWLPIPTEPIAGIRFANVTTTPSVQRRFFNVGACRGFVRASWAISGTTPSFTFGALLVARLT